MTISDRSHAGRRRVVIEHVQPEVDGGKFPIKRVVGERIVVQADIFADGHDALRAELLYRRQGERSWSKVSMHFLNNDRWQGEFMVEQEGVCYYTLEAWVDPFQTWKQDLQKRVDAGQDVQVDLKIGVTYINKQGNRVLGRDKPRLARLIRVLQDSSNPEKGREVALGLELETLMGRYPIRKFATRYDQELAIVVDRSKAQFSTWYERFPRSCASDPGHHGTFKDCERLLPEIARMGFDVLYLPPIHPIGKTNRKGKHNATVVGPEDPGSPWGIGSEEGGHMAVHPQLGTSKDFDRLLERAKGHGIEVAMDLAYQCSPDHPYVKGHPAWFRWRPDGTVQYAENPPKKYQDILPINFETEDWQGLWKELKRVVLFWIGHGIRIFRVDNPHTKPYSFWEWLISEVKRKHPDVIFLAEAFTRPKVMYRLAKLGFSQSYTYFTWRTTKQELTTYLTELTQTERREFFRPNFWPNTPDILPEHLQGAGRPAFVMRFILASTLSSNYGIYGPPFELCVNTPMAATEEYDHSEKYEIIHWDWDRAGHIKDIITRVNWIRRQNPALQRTGNIRFCEVDNPELLAYSKSTEDCTNIIVVVVNLSLSFTHSGWVHVPIGEWGIDPSVSYGVEDLLNGEKYVWQGEHNYVELNPHVMPAHIFRVSRSTGTPILKEDCVG